MPVMVPAVMDMARVVKSFMPVVLKKTPAGVGHNIR
jgi:hypothetical protein